MKVGVIERIDSMHRLPGHPRCGVPHGHTYTIEVAAEGPLREDGMVIDFADLQRHVREVLGAWDHADLNRFLEVPTCENLCRALLEQLRGRLGPGLRLNVRIWEGAGKYAEESLS